MPTVTGCAKILGTISLGLLTGSLATTSLITVPALLAVTPNADANHPLHLIRQRINFITTFCGTVSTSSFGLAFLLGAKHGYLLYSSVISAVLLRNQRATLNQIGHWLVERYEETKEFAIEYYAKKTEHRIGPTRTKRVTNGARQEQEEEIHAVPPQQVAGALERIGAACLANCFISGIAFGMASIGVLGDVL